MKAYVFALLLLTTPGGGFRGTQEPVLIQDRVGDACRWGAFGFDVCQKRV